MENRVGRMNDRQGRQIAEGMVAGGNKETEDGRRKRAMLNTLRTAPASSSPIQKDKSATVRRIEQETIRCIRHC